MEFLIGDVTNWCSLKDSAEKGDREARSTARKGRNKENLWKTKKNAEKTLIFIFISNGKGLYAKVARNDEILWNEASELNFY